MFSDKEMFALREKQTARLAEFRRVERHVDMFIKQLKVFAREGQMKRFDAAQQDLDQALTELWQLGSIHESA